MRRIIRLLTILSLVVCIGLSAAAIVRVVNISGPPLWLRINGRVVVATGVLDKSPEWVAARDVESHAWLDDQVWFVRWREPGEVRQRWFLRFNVGLVILASACLPLLRGGIWLLRFACFVRWTANGKCGRCGYDLRTNSGFCPECGTVTAEI
jgi:hypothetical protein